MPRTTPALQRRRTQQHARSSTCIPEQVRRNTQGCRNKTADRRTAREGVDENGDGREGVRACDVARGRVGACEPRTRWPRFIWPSRTARQARSGGLSGHTACASARTPGGRQGGRVAEIQAPPPLPCAGRHPVPPEYAAAPQQPVQRGRAAGGTGVNSCRPSRGTSHFPSTPPCLSALDWPEDALCWRDPVHVGAAFAQPAMTAGAELE